MPKIGQSDVPWAAYVRNRLRNSVNRLYIFYLRAVWHMDIGAETRVSLSARLDKTNPKGIHIGRQCSVNFDVAILTHDFVNRVHRDVHIGDRCLIGARTIIYPGVRIGDSCIVSAASVVMKDVPAGSLVAGNPARVMESGIETGPYGYLVKRAKPETADRSNVAVLATGAGSPKS